MCADSEEVGSPMRFDGFQVYRVTPKTIQQLEVLKKLEDDCTDYNFWTYASTIGSPVDIMVPPHKKSDFLNLLQNTDAELWIENVQERIENERHRTPGISKKYDWKRYHTLAELNTWLDSLVAKYPEIVRPVVGGKSHLGKSIRGVVVSYTARTSDTDEQEKKIVFLEGGIHAREWIAPATVTYILNQLLTSKDPSVRALAKSREWHVFPCVNPDGYVFSHLHDRMWRKNRKQHGKHFGVDLNRNWDFHWSEGHASVNPASDTFAGKAPFSEIETETLSKYINEIAENIEVYLAFHSYCQKILIPFGYMGDNNKPDNHEELQRIGQAAADSLASRYGTHVRVGNRAEILYPAGGVSVDWAKAVHKNIRLAFTYELRDTGTYGFLLPPRQIIPTAKETLDSVLRIFQELENPSSNPYELETSSSMESEQEHSPSTTSSEHSIVADNLELS